MNGVHLELAAPALSIGEPLSTTPGGSAQPSFDDHLRHAQRPADTAPRCEAAPSHEEPRSSPSSEDATVQAAADCDRAPPAANPETEAIPSREAGRTDDDSEELPNPAANEATITSDVPLVSALHAIAPVAVLAVVDVPAKAKDASLCEVAPTTPPPGAIPSLLPAGSPQPANESPLPDALGAMSTEDSDPAPAPLRPPHADTSAHELTTQIDTLELAAADVVTPVVEIEAAREPGDEPETENRPSASKVVNEVAKDLPVAVPASTTAVAPATEALGATIGETGPAAPETGSSTIPESDEPTPGRPDRAEALDATQNTSEAASPRAPNLALGRATQRTESLQLSEADRARFVQRVARAFETAGESGSLRLRLSPPELGALRLEVSVRQGVLIAHVEAETPQARLLLLDNLPALRDRLQEQNIKIERFDVDLMNQSPGGRPREQRSQEQAAEMLAANVRRTGQTSDDAPATRPMSARHLSGGDQLNVVI